MSDSTQCDFVLPFGKYKGKNIKDVAKEDGKYLLWLNKQEWVVEETKQEVLKSIKYIILDFGKHKGKTMSEVRQFDEKYYDWLLKN